MEYQNPKSAPLNNQYGLKQALRLWWYGAPSQEKLWRLKKIAARQAVRDAYMPRSHRLNQKAAAGYFREAQEALHKKLVTKTIPRSRLRRRGGVIGASIIAPIAITKQRKEQTYAKEIIEIPNKPTRVSSRIMQRIRSKVRDVPSELIESTLPMKLQITSAKEQTRQSIQNIKIGARHDVKKLKAEHRAVHQIKEAKTGTSRFKQIRGSKWGRRGQLLALGSLLMTGGVALEQHLRQRELNRRRLKFALPWQKVGRGIEKVVKGAHKLLKKKTPLYGGVAMGLVGHRIGKKQKQKQNYGILDRFKRPKPYTGPDTRILIAQAEKLRLQKATIIKGAKKPFKSAWSLTKKTGKAIGSGLSTAATTALLIHILRGMERKATRSHIHIVQKTAKQLPDVRFGVEERRGYLLDYAHEVNLHYAKMPPELQKLGAMSIKQLKKLQIIISTKMKSFRKGIIRSMGAFYLGLIANELVGRGISHKKVRQQQTIKIEPSLQNALSYSLKAKLIKANATRYEPRPLPLLPAKKRKKAIRRGRFHSRRRAAWKMGRKPLAIGLGSYGAYKVLQQLLLRQARKMGIETQSPSQSQPQRYEYREDYIAALLAKLGKPLLKGLQAAKISGIGRKVTSLSAKHIKKPVTSFLSKPTKSVFPTRRIKWSGVTSGSRATGFQKARTMTRGDLLKAKTGKTWRGTKKAGKFANRGLNIALTGLIAHDVGKAVGGAFKRKKQQPHVEGYNPYERITEMKNTYALSTALRKRLLMATLGGAGAASVGLAGAAIVKRKKKLKEFARGWQMGIRDGQLEVSGKKGPPGGIGMTLKMKLHGPGYAAGRQHALSRAGLHGGTASKIGTFETLVNTLRTKVKVTKEPEKYHETIHGPVIDPKKPAGTYICPEGCAVEITWKTPQDKYKLKCPKCQTDMKLKETKKNQPRIKADYQGVLHRAPAIGQRSFHYRKRN